MKIVIFGASGSGTTTLAKSLAKKLNWHHLDADEYYWAKTDIPFQSKLPLEQRNENLQKDFGSTDNLIVSGSLITWGKYWNSAFDLGIFLWVPKNIRMERLRNRELKRYGTDLQKDTHIKAKSEAFLEWASLYDDELFEGRSITQHKKWIKLLNCEVIEMKGDLTNKERIDTLIEKII